MNTTVVVKDSKVGPGGALVLIAEPAATYTFEVSLTLVTGPRDPLFAEAMELQPGDLLDLTFTKREPS